MLTSQPIKNHIIFRFNDAVDHDGKFIEKHNLLHIISGDFDHSAKRPRWGTVVMAGPDADADVRTPGTQILIENLKWTLGFTLDGQRLWRTDDSVILAVAEF